MKFATLVSVLAVAASSVFAQNYTNGGVSVTSPAYGAVWQAGTTQNIIYTVSDPSIKTIQGIVLYGGDQSNLQPYLLIDENVSVNGSYAWAIPKNVQTQTSYSLVLKTSSGTTYSPYFTIMGVATGGINTTSIDLNNLPSKTGASASSTGSAGNSTSNASTNAGASVKAGVIGVTGALVSAAALLL
ncbi:hypothetical protein BC940DRAFT_290177 [Gongronella butleri]|nr:hypothetical protein BC940DRAFT_290177 [Gongronella butleri]